MGGRELRETYSGETVVGPAVGAVVHVHYLKSLVTHMEAKSRELESYVSQESSRVAHDGLTESVFLLTTRSHYVSSLHG